MQIKILGHSSLYIEFLDLKILVDPCLQAELMGVFRRFPDLGDLDFHLPSPDMIILTHHHWDVVCIKTLVSFRRDLKILIPDNDQLITILNELGFSNVEVLEPWQSLELSGGQVTVIPSEVSFGELGFVLSNGDSTFLNLADCRITESIVEEINKRFPKVDLCFAPFQSYDEMAILKRENSRLSHQFLIEQASLISKIKSKVILPFKDGIYYPSSDLLNKKSFLYSPFQFMELLKEYNKTTQSDVLICLDEITLLDGKVNINRDDLFSPGDLDALFNQYRSYDVNEPYAYHEIEKSYGLNDLEEIQRFLLEDFYRYLNPKMKKQCRLEFVVFSIDIEDCSTGFEIDFNQSKIQLKPCCDLSTTCMFTIRLEDLKNLIQGRQLLSILMQTDRIFVKGLNDQMKYRALDIMFGAGFGDSLKIIPYINFLQNHSIISYGDRIESES